MKTKALVTTILLAATNFAWTQGGLGIENVEQHMNANNWDETYTSRAEIVAQGPIDKFDVVLAGRDQRLVDINKFKQTSSGQS